MATRRVIIEMREQVSASMLASSELRTAFPALAGVKLDATFPPVVVPSRSATEGGVPTNEVRSALGMQSGPIVDTAETYILRGTVDDDDLQLPASMAAESGPVVGVFADVSIQPLITCGGSPAVGDDHVVEQRLCVPQLAAKHMNGEGVFVAVVDTGVNIAYLNSKGKHPAFNKPQSWVPVPGLDPGNMPVNHGTMCAFDVCIAAPKCTLLDIAVLSSQAPGGSIMEGLLSDAVRAYAHLRTILRGPNRPKALVVTNSWGMFHPSWDYPVGHPGNYSDNPNHPFNRIVGTLEREGADILFAAGNCGNECPDGRCGGVTNIIYGANSHPKVLSVAGVDTNGNRVGYSTKGPGRLSHDKPDIASYTHFAGSGVYPVDSGTSAATPVAAGVVAAIRSRWPYVPALPPTWPNAVRQLIKHTAIDKGTPGYDLEYGWGIINSCRLVDAVPVSDGGAPPSHKADEPQAQPAQGGFPWKLPQAGDVGETRVPASVAAGTSITTGFVRLVTDSHPGRNVHNLVGLPTGTRAISIWVTEWVGPNNPHAGSAFISTSSVQLFENGTKCRFVYDSSWGSNLPVAAQFMYGTG